MGFKSTRAEHACASDQHGDSSELPHNIAYSNRGWPRSERARRVPASAPRLFLTPHGLALNVGIEHRR